MGKRKESPQTAGVLDGLLNIEGCWNQKDAEDYDAGIDYYSNFRSRVIRTAASVPDKTALGVYAALSPNNSEESCMDDTARLCRAYVEGEFASCTVHTYGKNKEKAHRILLGEDPAQVLRGIKTWNFFHNLLDPSDARYVTIDGHMVNVWNNRRVPLDWAGISEREYRMIAESIMLFARLVGLQPCQVQSILWLTWRRVNKILYKPQYQLFQ